MIVIRETSVSHILLHNLTIGYETMGKWDGAKIPRQKHQLYNNDSPGTINPHKIP